MIQIKMLLGLLCTFAFTSSAWALSGIGGSGGGPRAEVAAVGSLVTVEVCHAAEDYCKKVTYRVRAQGKPEPVKCLVSGGETGLDVPCPKNQGKPAWLTEMTKAFESGPKKGTVETAGETQGSTDFVGGP